MTAIRIIQWTLGLIVCFYLFKGMLGEFQDGDFSKAAIVAIVWLGLVAFTSGILKIA
jgi:hypothetical protein